MKRAGAAFLAISLLSRAASADEPSSVLDKLRAGKDLLGSVPTIAVYDGSWSLTLQAGTLLTSHRWAPPYPRGLAAQVATRTLYGTTWTAMLGLESLGAVVASGSRFDWIAEATYRTDWVFGYDVPAGCAFTGAAGGCGLGLGGFGGIHVRPVRSHWWFEISGGWLEQRVSSDVKRVLEESVWILTPIAAAYEVRAGDRDDPVAVRAQAGPGVYGGMHNAHIQPTVFGDRTLDVPWHEMYALDGGIGPGARAEARLIFARRFSLDAEAVLAPLVAGSVDRRPTHDIAPLDAARGGLPTWRYVGLGASWDDPSLFPMRLGLSYFAAELSGRPVTTLGHQGAMLRMEFPLRIPGRRSSE